MDLSHLFNRIYKGKTVLVTGHTGFKGSWLVYWLNAMGARVIGYSLEANTSPNHHNILSNSSKITEVIGNVLDLGLLKETIEINKIDVVFHMAAQSLVRQSYKDPIDTFATNVMGTINILEACRGTEVKAIVNVTSDKCYENNEIGQAFQESDKMGGHDPYSASKGAAEIVSASYRDSFFNTKDYGINHQTLIANARSGNVIGGGDWADDRLIPDAVRAANAKISVDIRSPQAIRPWQHVLEPLSGYLLLGQNLLEGNTAIANGWNFGPAAGSEATVKTILDKAQSCWSEIKINYSPNSDMHEATLLQLDCTKANKELKWSPTWNTELAVKKTISWYKSYYTNNVVNTKNDLVDYCYNANELGHSWAQIKVIHEI